MKKIDIDNFKQISCPLCKQYLYKENLKFGDVFTPDLLCKCKALELSKSSIYPFYISFKRYFFYIGYIYTYEAKYKISYNFDYRHKWIDFLKQNYNIEGFIFCINEEDLIEKIQFLLNTICNFERNQIFI